MVSLFALWFAHPRLDVVRLNPLNSLSDWLGWLAHVVMPVGWLVCLDVGKMFVDLMPVYLCRCNNRVCVCPCVRVPVCACMRVCVYACDISISIIKRPTAKC